MPFSRLPARRPSGKAALARSGGCALSLLLAACSPQTGGDAGVVDSDGGSLPVDAGPLVAVWQPAFDASSAGSLSSVWGSGPHDVFMVGGDDEGGTILHYDGADWTPMTLPASAPLAWVYGFAADDVLAVGRDGGALRFDGETWTALDTDTDVDLWGVFGFTPDDVWMVGGEVDTGEPLLLRYDGDGFTAVPLAADQNPSAAHALFKVWGKNGRLVAVGQRGLILEYVDGAWLRRPAGEAADDDFVSLWGFSEDRIVAVGGRANARIATFDGSSWTTTAPVGVPGLNAVFMDTPGTALVAGLEGTVGLANVADLTLVFEDTDTRYELHALWGDGDGRHYAVGGTFFSPHRGVALVRTLSP